MGSQLPVGHSFSWKCANFLFLILVLHQIRLEWAGGIRRGWGKTGRQLGGQADRPCDCLSHISLGSQAKNNQNPVLSHKQLWLPQTDAFPVKKCFVREFPVVPAEGREGGEGALTLGREARTCQAADGAPLRLCPGTSGSSGAGDGELGAANGSAWAWGWRNPRIPRSLPHASVAPFSRAGETAFFYFSFFCSKVRNPPTAPSSVGYFLRLGTS